MFNIRVPNPRWRLGKYSSKQLMSWFETVTLLYEIDLKENSTGDCTKTPKEKNRRFLQVQKARYLCELAHRDKKLYKEAIIQLMLIKQDVWS